MRRTAIKNFSLATTLLDGTKLDHSFSNCRDLLDWLVGYDMVPSIINTEIVVMTLDGRTVRIVIPNDTSTTVYAMIEEAIN